MAGHPGTESWLAIYYVVTCNRPEERSTDILPMHTMATSECMITFASARLYYESSVIVR